MIVPSRGSTTQRNSPSPSRHPPRRGSHRPVCERRAPTGSPLRRRGLRRRPDRSARSWSARRGRARRSAGVTRRRLRQPPPAPPRAVAARRPQSFNRVLSDSRLRSSGADAATGDDHGARGVRGPWRREPTLSGGRPSGWPVSSSRSASESGSRRSGAVRIGRSRTPGTSRSRSWAAWCR